ncbi:hypothetical protein ABPG77_002261 [Micractinium sp. CCAP 211/92]
MRASRRSTASMLAMALLCVVLVPAVLADEHAVGDPTAAASAPVQAATRRAPVIQLRPQDSWVVELCALAFLATFLVNLFVGRRRNEQLALAWTTQLVAPDGVLDRNFSLLGPGDTAAGEVLLKDSMHCYKFWASGRRFCQGMLATFNLVRRQDLLAWGVMALRGQKDVLDLEVRMNEGAMPPLVLVVAQPTIARELQQGSDDVKSLCKRLEPTRDRIAQWPERLTVLAEHSSIFYDLMTPQLLDLAFSKEAFESLRPYFRYLHITSDAPDGPHAPVVRLSFVLPPQGDHATLNKFLALALLLADLLGSYKLSPEQEKRAREARQRREAADAKQGGGGQADERARRAEERRQAKLEAERERLRRLPPEQRAKELERKQKIQMRRHMAKFAKKG